MATGRLAPILRHIHAVGGASTSAGPSDRELLERFIHFNDEAAFAALVGRHGPMVLGVCRRVTRHAHDAEDAFQATFCILARKAPSVRNVASYLYGVAFRVTHRTGWMRPLTVTSEPNGQPASSEDQ